MSSSVQLAEIFFQHFRKQAGDIQRILDESGGLARARELLTILRSDISQATVSLPTYDQARYERQWKDLERAITAKQTEESGSRTAANAKPKFSFKRNAKASSSGTSGGTGASESKISSGSQEGGIALGSASEAPRRVTEQPAEPSASHTITSQRNRYIVSPVERSGDSSRDLPSILSTPASYSLSISSMAGCYINLLPSRSNPADEPVTDRLTALYVNDVEGSVIVAPIIGGSVMVTNVRNSLLAVGCQQFRMHNSTNCTVLLRIPSSPIIEHCSDVRFGAYSDSVAGTTGTATSKHHEVLDFDWVRPGPSPNWTRLDGIQANGEEAGSGQESMENEVWLSSPLEGQVLEGRIRRTLRTYGVRQG